MIAEMGSQLLGHSNINMFSSDQVGNYIQLDSGNHMIILELR